MKAKTNFIKIYNSIFNIEELNITDITLLSILISINSNNEKIYISDDGINKLTNGKINARTSKRTIKKLKDLELISSSTKANVKGVNNYGGKTRFITISNEVLQLVKGEIDSIVAEKIEAKIDNPKIKNLEIVKEPTQPKTTEKFNDFDSYNLKDMLNEVIDDNELALKMNNWFVGNKKYFKNYQENINQSSNKNELILSSKNLLKLLNDNLYNITNFTKYRLKLSDVRTIINNIEAIVTNKLIVA